MMVLILLLLLLLMMMMMTTTTTTIEWMHERGARATTLRARRMQQLLLPPATATLEHDLRQTILMHRLQLFLAFRQHALREGARGGGEFPERLSSGCRNGRRWW